MFVRLYVASFETFGSGSFGGPVVGPVGFGGPLGGPVGFGGQISKSQKRKISEGVKSGVVGVKSQN